MNWGLPTALASDAVVAGIGGVTTGSHVAFRAAKPAEQGVASLVRRLSPKDLGKYASTVVESVQKRVMWVVGEHGGMSQFGRRKGLAESHHGVLSKWMETHYGSAYSADKAPGVLMSKADHAKTVGATNTWMSEMREKMGGEFKWEKVSAEEARGLANRLFDAAGTPASVREEYMKQFDAFRQTLDAAKKAAAQSGKK
ncbi:MAG: hypothetical protein IPI67_33120 [Myxococcales bacterium]|nr:hypothetical protein [Myxococcales bacterium]